MKRFPMLCTIPAIAGCLAISGLAVDTLAQPQPPSSGRQSPQPEFGRQQPRQNQPPPQYQPQGFQHQPPEPPQQHQQQYQPQASQHQPPPPQQRPEPRQPPPQPRAEPRPESPRSPYTVREGWPLQRPPRPVIVNPPPPPAPRVPPRIYLPLLPFGGGIVDDRYYRDYRYYDYPRPYVRDRLTWLDGQTLYREDGWTEFTLDCGARGEQLWFEVRDGRVRLDWVEIVFEDGESQVVDFSERSIGPGVYSMLRFRAGRRVDHVRIVAEATTRQVRLILRMEL